MGHFHWRGFIAAALTVLCALSASAGPEDGFLLFTDPEARFSVEFPKDWEWSIVAGSGEALVVFVQPKKEAAIVVEHSRMKQSLAPEDVTDVFAQIEGEVLKENQPRATGIAAQIVKRNGLPRVLVDYSRPGVGGGEPQRVRQYSMPTGRDLYRVTCMALSSQFKKYDATFGAVAETLKSAASLKPAGGTTPQRGR